MEDLKLACKAYLPHLLTSGRALRGALVAAWAGVNRQLICQLMATTAQHHRRYDSVAWIERRRLKDESHTDLTNIIWVLLLLMKPKSLWGFFKFPAIDLLYGGIYCFMCQDYIYDKDMEQIAKDEQRKAWKMQGKRTKTRTLLQPPLHVHFNDAFIIQPGAEICVTTNIRVVPPAGSSHPTPNNLHGWCKCSKKDRE